MVSIPSAGVVKPVPSGMHASSRPKTSNGTTPRPNIPLSARRAERLDMNSVERKCKPLAGSPESATRKHFGGIPEAPTFRPTEEEWKNPYAYMKSIEAEGKRHGIIKIIPPETWNPDFVIDTEVSRTITHGIYDVFGSTFSHSGSAFTSRQGSRN